MNKVTSFTLALLFASTSLMAFPGGDDDGMPVPTNTPVTSGVIAPYEEPIRTRVGKTNDGSRQLHLMSADELATMRKELRAEKAEKDEKKAAVLKQREKKGHKKRAPGERLLHEMLPSEVKDMVKSAQREIEADARRAGLSAGRSLTGTDADKDQLAEWAEAAEAEKKAAKAEKKVAEAEKKSKKKKKSKK